MLLVSCLCTVSTELCTYLGFCVCVCLCHSSRKKHRRDSLRTTASAERCRRPTFVRCHARSCQSCSTCLCCCFLSVVHVLFFLLTSRYSAKVVCGVTLSPHAVSEIFISTFGVAYLLYTTIFCIFKVLITS